MNKNKVFSNLLWRFFERCGAQGVAFIVQIILARLLDPEVYGAIALVTAITTILMVFVDSGFGNALIQKKEADELDFSSVFYFNLAICFALYLLLFAFAPLIARFYGIPELKSVIRVLGTVVIIAGIRNVQQAYVSRNMMFKRFFFATLGGTIGSAAVGIAMACMGYGIWALVAQTVLNNLLGTVILWFTVKWRPTAEFSLQRLKGLFSYGWKLLASSLIDTVSTQLWQLVIGKKYTSDDLAFYNRGVTFPNIIVTNINSSIDSVLLPALSAKQDDVDNVRAMTRRAIQVSSYIMWPLMIGLFVCAEPIVSLLLTDKWLPCVPFIRIFCITYAFYPIHTANLNAIKAMGRSDVFLKLEIIKKIINLAILLITMWFGILTMAYGVLAEGIICQVINAWPNRKLIDYKYTEQVKDIVPYILLSALMGLCCGAVTLLHLGSLATLCIQVILGAAVYIALSMLLKIPSFNYILDIAKMYLRKRKTGETV